MVFLSAQLSITYAKNNRTVIVTTQKQLDSAIRDTKCNIIKIVTKKKATFKISNDKRTKNKTLVVNAPNATVINTATFQKINILAIENSKAMLDID